MGELGDGEGLGDPTRLAQGEDLADEMDGGVGELAAMTERGSAAYAEAANASALVGLVPSPPAPARRRWRPGRRAARGFVRADR